jgi:kynurenine formamidase
LDAAGRDKVSKLAGLEHRFAGLDGGHDMAEFLHDNYFAAVGSDSPTLESWPMDEPHHLHHFLLPLWGAPIGEMWDLDVLVDLCKKNNRGEFFFSSTRSNVQGKSELGPGRVRI